MDLGRSEHAEPMRKAVRLKKAEKLLEETLVELKDLIEQLEFEYGTGRSFRVEGQDPLTEREEKLVDHIEFLLDYSRRIAQRQVIKEDTAILLEIRKTLKEVKNGKR